MKANEILAPFSANYAGMCEMVSALDDDELQEFITACQTRTQTNCWWADYRAAQTMLPEAIEEKRQREQLREVAAIATSSQEAASE